MVPRSTGTGTWPSVGCEIELCELAPHPTVDQVVANRVRMRQLIGGHPWPWGRPRHVEPSVKVQRRQGHDHSLEPLRVS